MLTGSLHVVSHDFFVISFIETIHNSFSCLSVKKEVSTEKKKKKYKKNRIYIKKVRFSIQKVRILVHK